MYAVEWNVEYESGGFSGVFSTLEKAIEFVESMLTPNNGVSRVYDKGVWYVQGHGAFTEWRIIPCQLDAPVNLDDTRAVI